MTRSAKTFLAVALVVIALGLAVFSISRAVRPKPKLGANEMMEMFGPEARNARRQ